MPREHLGAIAIDAEGAAPFIVGVLAVGGPDSHSGNIVPSALAALGWVDGRNIRLLVREGNGDIESLTPLIDELVGLPADVVVARGGAVIAKLLERTGAPPVVMSATSLDPAAGGMGAELCEARWQRNRPHARE